MAVPHAPRAPWPWTWAVGRGIIAHLYILVYTPLHRLAMAAPKSGLVPRKTALLEFTMRAHACIQHNTAQA